jgi:acetoin utilization protein AcuB
MSKSIPTIQKYMTLMPHAINTEESVGRASGIMRDNRIRHLPVMHGSRLIGILTDRDIKLIESVGEVDLETMTVDYAMSVSPYAVSPEAPLDEVVQEMADKKYGCAVIVQEGAVIGIFTMVDACQALADLLHTRLAK